MKITLVVGYGIKHPSLTLSNHTTNVNVAQSFVMEQDFKTLSLLQMS